ncbi:hypothetical protein CU097_015106 [Rhizopus azygosporus]|uniref:Uncharacterized protein n=1 Tax=Rhizopus azygosporus TaxID=86630 RepID=A0A367KA27_RHIAZ|nr:hypothetical protein CU097_015106 [Rhizopus azygosporus]
MPMINPAPLADIPSSIVKSRSSCICNPVLSFADDAAIGAVAARYLDDTICLWSLRYEHEERLYELWLERRLLLEPGFEKLTEELLNLINFYWSMKVNLQQKNSANEEYMINDFIPYKNLLEEAVDAILELQEEHKKKLGLYRFTTPTKETLDIVVNPSILKLTEEYDKAGMHHLGPFFTSTF